MRQSQASHRPLRRTTHQTCVLILPSLLVKVAHTRLLHFGRKDRAALLAGLEPLCECFKAFKNPMPHNRPASTHANITRHVDSRGVDHLKQPYGLVVSETA